MASIVLLRNPLDPSTREIVERPVGSTVIDWLIENHPHGFGMPVKFFLNGEERPIDDLDHRLREYDVAAIALMPADPVTLTTIGISLLISAVLSVATYFAMQAFMPKEAGALKGGKISTFDVSSDQNAAKIGEPIPVVYGEVLMTPDYVAQPYSWFDWSQSSIYSSRYNGVQYLDMLLCVGQGIVDVKNVYVGDTDADDIAKDEDNTTVVTWKAFTPTQHQKNMGTISASMGGGFHENVVTSPEVSNQEFVQVNQKVGPFSVCKPGLKGSKIQIDIIFPGGHFDPDSSGDIKGRTTSFTVYWQEIDDLDNPVGAENNTPILCSTNPSATVTGPAGVSVVTSSTSTKNQTAITSPIRRSYIISTGRSARWRVRIVRNTVAPNAQNGTDRFVWSGLKLYADYPSIQAYGDVTLLAVRIKASQGLGQDASTRIKVRAARRVSRPDGSSIAVSSNGADAFADVYTDAVYGASRPRTELDVTTLTSLRDKWSAYKFNYVFRSRTTVWEALRTITTPFGAEPLPLGAMMSVAQDGVKAVRSALFTDANIIAGTMNVTYSFDEEGAADGVEVEYLDPKDFRNVFSTYPSGSVEPARYTLDGVTSSSHADQYARLTWQRRQLQRKRISFDTELEGLILQLGDRIGVSHNVPKWGDSGLVLSRVGTNRLYVDHNLDWSGSAKFMMLRRRDGSVTDPLVVTKGAQSNEAVFAVPIPITPDFDNAYEYTSFAFGDATTLVRDFIVTSVRPTGENTVTVEAVNYAPEIYTGAMTYMVT